MPHCVVLFYTQDKGVLRGKGILLWDSDSQGRADRGESWGEYGWEAYFGQSSSKEPMCCSCMLKTPCVLSRELTELCFSREADFTPRKSSSVKLVVIDSECLHILTSAKTHTTFRGKQNQIFLILHPDSLPSCS